MSDHWYGQCEVCGARVHKGFLCGCGNDLHGVIKEMEQKLEKSRLQYEQSKVDLGTAHAIFLDNEIEVACIKAIQEERKTRRNMEFLRGS